MHSALVDVFHVEHAQPPWGFHPFAEGLPGAVHAPEPGAEPFARRSAPGECLLLYVCYPYCNAPYEGPITRSGCQVVVGLNIRPTPFFPDSFGGWRLARHDLACEWNLHRLVDGYPGWPPMIGSDWAILLPNNEVAAVRCLMIHPDGTWEGRIAGDTVNDLTPEQLARTNLKLRVAGAESIAQPGAHGFRKGHVVRVRRDGMAWVPAEEAGGMA